MDSHRLDAHQRFTARAGSRDGDAAPDDVPRPDAHALTRGRGYG